MSPAPRRLAAPLAALALAALTLSAVRADDAGPLPVFDLTRPDQAAAWHAQHHIGRLSATPEGLEVAITGDDPYLAGPARDFPPGGPLVLRARVWSQRGGGWQVFFHDQGPAEERRSVRFDTAANTWTDVVAPLPALGPATRFRIDPPGPDGLARIARLAFAPIAAVDLPSWPKPELLAWADTDPRVASGALTLRHAPARWGGFKLLVDGQEVAAGANRPLIGYVRQGKAVWIDVARQATVTEKPEGDGLRVEARLTDPDQGRWTLSQTFIPGGRDALTVTTEVRVDADREVVFLPLLMVHPGLGTHGARKGQGLFAGVEYLDDEPSRSEADLEGPEADRLVPLARKITFPLMAVQAAGRYVGLVWEPADGVAALFDSPDRTFGSDAHVLGLIAPGAGGTGRLDGALFPYDPAPLRAGQALACRALIVGGRGGSIVPAVQQYVALRGLPPVPPMPELRAYLELAGRSWLDSPVREGARFRHAVAGGGFPAHPAADAAWMIERLAALDPSGPLADRLRATAAEAIGAVSPGSEYHATVSHLRAPVAPLVFDRVVQSMSEARSHARGLLARFDASGAVVYRAGRGGVDYGRTNPTREASGYAAVVAAEALRSAAFSGDRALVADALRALRNLDRFRDGVPRGAQTWEVPLHTPDVLAAAHLVHAYTLGYELCGDAGLLASARYWAWAGLPFVYLVNPTGQQVGPYATTPVLGATGWVAPVWIGRPVQWCGMVYADALAALARHDPAGPWSQVAAGITASGLQQSYPLDHPHRGLLPDSFVLATQSRAGPDINPGTIEPLALRFLTGRPSYDLRALRVSGLWVHAPGAIEPLTDRAGHAAFRVVGWGQKPHHVVVHGLRVAPRVEIDGREVSLRPQHQFLADPGSLVLRLEGTASVDLEFDAAP